MFINKDLDFGFVVLCPQPNIALLTNTAKSLKIYHEKYPYVGVVSNLATPPVIKEMKDAGHTVYKAKDTITSMLNTGLRNCPAEWCIFVMAGSWVRRNLAHKFSRFITEDSDILFPIVDYKCDFINCSLNGLCINKKTFKKVGPFGEQGKLEKLKEEWALYAVGICNTKFKAILGAQVL
jgi:hypothetical protein